MKEQGVERRSGRNRTEESADNVFAPTQEQLERRKQMRKQLIMLIAESNGNVKLFGKESD